MVYRKNQRKQSLMMCIIAIVLFIVGVTAGTISYAYFSDSAKAENILNFGKLRIQTNANEKVEVKLTENATTSGKLAPNDTVTISGEIGLEKGSVNAYIRMKIIVYEKGKEVEIDSTFNDAFMAEMAKLVYKDSNNVEMKWYVAEDGYMYLGNEIGENSQFAYSNNVITLTNEMIPEVLQGVGVDVVFVYQAIQSAGMGLSITGYSQPNAEAISKLDAWTEYNKQDFELGTWTAPTHTANAMDGYGTFNKGAMVDGKYTHIQFGKYPQTRYTGDTTTNALKNTGRKYVLYKNGASGAVKVEYDIYRNNSTNKEYIKMDSANSFDLEYKYSDGTAINGLTDVWFKLEPIVWQILGGYDGKSRANLLLSSVKALTAMKFGDNSLYKDSKIKSYLENEFYAYAFTYAEKKKINKYVSIVTATSGDGTNDETSIGTTQTNSTVFLLGYGDMIKSTYGFNNNATTKDNARVRYPTDYAGANMAFRNKENSSYGNWWWLRSRYVTEGEVRGNNVDGDMHFGYSCGAPDGGCVPALYLNI